MQNVETCPQEEALKAVLLNLGFKEEELQDLHAVTGVTWRLVCRVVNLSVVFAHGLGCPLLGRYDRNRQFKTQQECMPDNFFTIDDFQLWTFAKSAVWSLTTGVLRPVTEEGVPRREDRTERP